jgi:hypothetical protein
MRMRKRKSISGDARDGACIEMPDDTLVHWRSSAGRRPAGPKTKGQARWRPDCKEPRLEMIFGAFTGGYDKREVTCLQCLAWRPK